MASSPKSDPGFEVTPWVHALGGFISRHPKLWTRLGNLETRLLADEIEEVRIERPIYVTGLARSGTTKLLETLNAHDLTVSHRYSDYPPVFTPYLWNRVLARMPQKPAAPSERAHRDGIVVTPDSPEAFEEVLWMAFFDHLHDPARSAVLDRTTVNPAFEAFYPAHIRKLLRVRGGRRYLAKGNYNLTRLGYLLKLFRDARFVIPVRDPVWHIASLMKQHRLFSEGEAKDARALEHMRRVGHFEFGLDRRPVNVGDGAAGRVQDAWAEGAEVPGWATYWASLHDHLLARLDADPALAAAALVVRYEELCAQPEAVLERIMAHVGLEAPPDWIRRMAGGFHLPTYYRPSFSDEDVRTIRDVAGRTAAALGYDPGALGRAAG